MSLDVRRLRLLRELEAHGTIAAVADALSFSPSAVSQQLAQLERESGAQLLERVGRGVRLTPVARSVLDRVDRVLSELDEVEAMLASAAGEPTGTITITTFQSAGIELVPAALTALARDAPRLRVDVIESEPEDALPALAVGHVDLVIADDYGAAPRARDPRLHREDLLADAIVLALPSKHPAARSGAPVNLADLSDEAWAFTRDETSYAHMARRACRELGGFTPSVRYHANDLTIVCALVAAGHAVGFVPELIGRDWPGVAFRPVADRPLKRTVFTAARMSSADHPAIVTLRRALAREALVRGPRSRIAGYAASAAASKDLAPAPRSRSATSRPAADG